MTTPTGTIKASDIASEFGYSGANNSVSLGNYRVTQSVSGLSSLPLDTNIPQSVAVGNSAINFGSFRGKKLNIVVDCTPAPNTVATRVNARSNYDNNTSITYIGNFAFKPSSTAGKKVWIHTNGTIGSNAQSSIEYCSLLTGSWDAATELIVDIGPSGGVYGAGGNGGRGGNTDSENTIEAGIDGSNGTSALGVTVTNSVIISNRGSIVAGGGGGGGGGGGSWYTEGGRKHGNQFSVSGGSGGGGGRGYPGGTGGSGGSASARARWSGYVGRKGGDGTTATSGDGGAANGGGVGGAGGGDNGAGGPLGGGGSGEGSSTGGKGGNGGNITTAAEGGGSGSGGGAISGSAGGGNGGANGYAVVISNNGTGVTINGSEVVGSTVYNTNAI